VEYLEAVGGTVEVDGGVQVEAGDSDVIDTGQHLPSAPPQGVMAQRAHRHILDTVTLWKPLSTLA
jgi:hypothetical protein